MVAITIPADTAVHRQEGTSYRSPVAAVVVNWNTRALLRDCLAGLHAHLGREDEICVVDNGSVDGSLDDIEQDWPGVQVIRNTDNLGFCRASNKGIRATAAPYVLLINTDGFLTEGCLETMAAHLHNDPTVALVGPRLVYGDGTFQRWTAGRPVTLWTCAGYYLMFERLAGSRSQALRSIYIRSDTDAAEEVGWVSSAVMLVRRSALDEIGLLDEDIFLYMDDVDICDRARRRGYRVVYAGDATAMHFMGSSSERAIDGRASPAAIRSLLRWFETRHGAAQATVLRMIVGAGFGLRWALFGVRSVIEGGRGSSRQRADAHLANLKIVVKGFV